MPAPVSAYITQVVPRTCECRLAGKQLSRHKSLDKAIATIDGYWSVYLAFFGDQMVWLEFSVIDIRDGRIMWRNGRPLVEGVGNGTSARQ